MINRTRKGGQFQFCRFAGKTLKILVKETSGRREVERARPPLELRLRLRLRLARLRYELIM